MKFKTLCDALLERRASKCTLTYIEGENDEKTLDFGEIHQRALGLLHHFQSCGARPGSEMILLLERNEQFIDAFWACLLGGIIAIPLAPGSADEHRRKFFRVLRQLKHPHLCSDSKTYARLRGFASDNSMSPELERVHGARVLLDQLEDISRAGKVHAVQPDDIAFVQYSSGSTSEPKGVILTHRNLLTNIDGIEHGMELRRDDSALSWMPLTHDMGLIGFHLTWLVTDITHCLMPTALFVRRPSLWLLKATEKRATLLCSPNFGYKHFLKTYDPAGSRPLDLSAVRLIFNGAEPISIALCEQFLKALAPTGLKREAMFMVYGLAEASLAVTFPQPGAPYQSITVKRGTLGVGDSIQPASPDDADALTLACVGFPIEHCEVRIADHDGKALPDRMVGRVLIRGGNVSRGYYQDAEATRNAVSPDGGVDTGDLGFMHEDGLVITGRLKDIIFVNGQNFYPQDIEALLAHHAGVELGKMAVSAVRPQGADADEMLVFVLHRGSPEEFVPVVKEVQRHVNEQTGVMVDRVVPVGRIPKTTSGKIQRYLLAQEFQAGAFTQMLAELDRHLAESSAPPLPPRSRIEKELKDICDIYLKDKPLGVNDNIFELGTSSLTLAQIYQRIEAIYPGQIEVTDFFDYPTIAELAGYLEKRLAAA